MRPSYVRRAGALAAAAAIAVGTASCSFAATRARPRCGTDELSTVALVAQTVRTAALVPCVDVAPAGWEFEGLDARNNEARIMFSNDRGGHRALEVRLAPTCETGAAVRIPSDEPGTQRYERVDRVDPAFVGSRYYLFDGGCVEYRFQLETRQPSVLLNEATLMVGFMPRTELREAIRDDTDGYIKDGP
jgi:hypothetical protein